MRSRRCCRRSAVVGAESGERSREQTKGTDNAQLTKVLSGEGSPIDRPVEMFGLPVQMRQDGGDATGFQLLSV